MKSKLQKSEGRTHSVPGVRAKSRWLKFLVVLLLLAANAGVVNGANNYWYNRLVESSSSAVNQDLRGKLGTDENPKITSYADGSHEVMVTILTWDGGDGGGGLTWLDVYVGPTKLYSLGDCQTSRYDPSSGGTYRIDPNRSYNPYFYGLTKINGNNGEVWIKNSRTYLTLKFRLPERFWGEQAIRFDGNFKNTDTRFDFTKNPEVEIVKKFTYGNNPYVVSGSRVATDKISLTFQRLPNVPYASNIIVLPSNDKRETTPNPNFPATITHVFTDNSDPGVAKSISGMKSEISFDGKTDSYTITSFNLPRLPSIENLKLTYNQNSRRVVVNWDVNRNNAQKSSLDRVVILRKEKSSSTWGNIYSNFNIYSTNDLSSYSITDTNIAFDKEYDYAVVYYQYSSNWLGTSFAIPNVLYSSGITGLQAVGTIKTTAVHDINLTGSFDLVDGAVLNWNSDKSSIYSPSSFQILKNGTLIATISYDVTKDSYQYKDASIKGTSTTYKYQIRHVVNNTILIKNFLSNEVNVTAVQSAKITKTQAKANIRAL